MKKLLLHCCCAVCASSVLERLENLGEYEIAVFFSNSNIMPKEEYDKRKDALVSYLNQVHPTVEFFEDAYNNAEYVNMVSDLIHEKEGGARCGVCIKYRLMRTAKKAKEMGCDVFTTTLSVSPHKNADLINSLGKEVSVAEGVEFLPANFKKQNGFLRANELSRQYNIYRQNYCGCKF